MTLERRDMIKKSSKGFSLLEIVLAMGFAGMVVISLFGFIGFVFAGIKHGKLTAQATTVASRYIEKIKGDIDTARSLMESGTPVTVEEVVIDPITNVPRQYTVTTQMAPVSTGSNLGDLVVRVEWKEKQKTNKVLMETYLNMP